jgi:hypothetical protein
MNIGIATVAAQFLFWEYFVSNFQFVSLQCTPFTVESHVLLNSALFVVGSNFKPKRSSRNQKQNKMELKKNQEETEAYIVDVSLSAVIPKIR